MFEGDVYIGEGVYPLSTICVVSYGTVDQVVDQVCELTKKAPTAKTVSA